MAQAYQYKSLMASHLHECMVPAKKNGWYMNFGNSRTTR